MDKFMVAKSYSGYTYDETKAYKNSCGKLVVDATYKCSRCMGGIYPSRIENGAPVPHPNAGGVCFECGGSSIAKRTIRLYTPEEFEKKQAAEAKAKAKINADIEARMKAEYAENKKKWLAENGFNENLTTFIYFPADSYDRRAELKDAGFRFSQPLLWHSPIIPTGYEDSVVEISLDKIGEFSAWGKANYTAEAKNVINDILAAARPEVESGEWVGEIGERLKDIAVSLVSVRVFESRYGMSQVVKFRDADGNNYTWFTAVDINFEPGDSILLTGTIKSHDEYRNEKSTVLTRCKLKEA